MSSPWHHLSKLTNLCTSIDPGQPHLRNATSFFCTLYLEYLAKQKKEWNIFHLLYLLSKQTYIFLLVFCVRKIWVIATWKSNYCETSVTKRLIKWIYWPLFFYSDGNVSYYSRFSVSNRRPHSDCSFFFACLFLSSYLSPFLPTKFLRNGWIDFLDIFRNNRKG